MLIFDKLYIPRLTSADELNEYLKSLVLWRHVQKLSLKTNRRVQLQNGTPQNVSQNNCDNRHKDNRCKRVAWIWRIRVSHIDNCMWPDHAEDQKNLLTYSYTRPKEKNKNIIRT